MKALFVGLGSIGQRHLVNFKKIMGTNTEALAYRETDHNILIANGIGKKCDSLERYYGFRQFRSLGDALRESPEIVFVTNPSSKHLETALESAKHNCNLFIEKPLSHNLNKIHLLKKETESRNLTVMVGHQMRFHPCYKLVRAMLAEKKYGNIISANFEWGTYLPSHHPYEDYRRGYAGVKGLGGGVILGLIHEIDMIYSFWGQPKKLFTIGGKFSSLEINVEDTVFALMAFEHNKRTFPLSLFLSYAHTKEVRKFKIQLDCASIFCDLLENTVNVFNEAGRLIIKESYPQLEKNDLFLEEMKEFISAVQKKHKPLISLDDGIESLRLAMKIKEDIID